MTEARTRSSFGLEDDGSLEVEDTQKDKFLTFRLAKEDYGISIRHVTEIIGLQTITEIPDMPAFVKGVINLRGKVIPVMDVRARFKLPGRDYDERTCIVVVNVDDRATGLVVDRVNEVADIPAEQIEAAPVGARGASSSFIHGLGKIGDSVKILLDVNRLLYQ
jgi:purine-binding chemotaxis protein CheW